MLRHLHTAVAAAAAEPVRTALMHALAEANVELLCMERDACSAFEALQRFRPDLLVADEHLPQLEGAQLILRAAISRALPVRPAAILLHTPTFLSPHQGKLEKTGAAIIEKPLTGEKLARAVAQLSAMPPSFPEQEQLCAEQLLDELGIPHGIGRQCLKCAALLCASDTRCRQNLTRRLYPAVAALCGVSPAQAERTIRHAIDHAWQSNQFENQSRIFADTVDAGRGQPTCGQMISRLADILRLEG